MDDYSITNTPEMNNQKIQRATLDQDVYQFGITLAIIEVGLLNY